MRRCSLLNWETAIWAAKPGQNQMFSVKLRSTAKRRPNRIFNYLSTKFIFTFLGKWPLFYKYTHVQCCKYSHSFFSFRNPELHLQVLFYKHIFLLFLMLFIVHLLYYKWILFAVLVAMWPKALTNPFRLVFKPKGAT